MSERAREVGGPARVKASSIRLPIALFGAVVSGALLAVAFSLHPLWWVAWLAPIPLLFVSTRVTWARAVWLGGLAGLIASASLFAYLFDLGGVWAAVFASVARAAQWALVAWAANRAFTRLPLPLAVFVAPAVFAGLDVLVSLVSPHGSAGSLAYSQMDALPVVQLASLGGTSAMVFVVMLGASGTVACVQHPRAWAMLLVPAVVLVGALGFGVARLAQAPANPAVTGVGLVASDAFPGVPTDWRAVWAEYEAGIADVAADPSVYLVVLPEKLFRIEGGDVAQMLELVAATAASADVDIVFGADVREGDEAHNRAYLVSYDGAVESYDKRHLIPGFENDFTAGDASLTGRVVGTQVAVLICKDLDFPATAREASATGPAGSTLEFATMLAVPGWDFGEDAWFHSRIAMLRGVENGVPVVRSAREGLMTASDAYGRLLAEAPSLGDTASPPSGGASSLVAAVPVAPVTAPARVVGELFGWLCLLVAVVAVAASFVPRAARRTAREMPHPAA